MRTLVYCGLCGVSIEEVGEEELALAENATWARTAWRGSGYPCLGCLRRQSRTPDVQMRLILSPIYYSWAVEGLY